MTFDMGHERQDKNIWKILGIQGKKKQYHWQFQILSKNTLNFVIDCEVLDFRMLKDTK